jgi:hypothetical protein
MQLKMTMQFHGLHGLGGRDVTDHVEIFSSAV